MEHSVTLPRCPFPKWVLMTPAVLFIMLLMGHIFLQHDWTLVPDDSALQQQQQQQQQQQPQEREFSVPLPPDATSGEIDPLESQIVPKKDAIIPNKLEEFGPPTEKGEPIFEPSEKSSPALDAIPPNSSVDAGAAAANVPSSTEAETEISCDDELTGKCKARESEPDNQQKQTNIAEEPSSEIEEDENLEQEAEEEEEEEKEKGIPVATLTTAAAGPAVVSSSEIRQGIVYFTPISSGLGDRLRGLVVSYYLAMLLGWKLEVMNPVRDDSLISIPKALAPAFEAERPGLKWYQHFCNNCGDKMQFENFTALQAYDVIQVTTNKGDLNALLQNPTLLESPWRKKMLEIQEQGMLFSTALKDTMRPGERVEKLLGAVKHDHLDGSYFVVAIHIRVSDLNMRRTKRGADRTPERFVKCFPQQVVKLWDSVPAEEKQQRYRDGLRVFITADTPAYALEVQKILTKLNVTWFDTTPYAGEPVHIRAKTDQTRTMLDWWLFTQMDFIVAARSGFSETAAKYACNNYAVQCPQSYSFDRRANDCDKLFVYRKPGLCQPMKFDSQPYYCP